MPTVLLYNTQKKHTQQISQFFSLARPFYCQLSVCYQRCYYCLCAFFLILAFSLNSILCAISKTTTIRHANCSLVQMEKVDTHDPISKKKKDLNTRTLLAKNLIIDKATTNLTLILYTLQSPIIEWWSHRWYYHEIIGQLKEMISSKEHIIIYHANTLIVHCAFITNDWLSSYH